MKKDIYLSINLPICLSACLTASQPVSQYAYTHTHTHTHTQSKYFLTTNYNGQSVNIMKGSNNNHAPVTVNRDKFLQWSQLDALISQIYFGIKLYMFRTVPLSIIRSFSLYTQQWYIPSLCVQWKIPDEGQRDCPKHVEFYSKNKFEKLVHLVCLTLILLMWRIGWAHNNVRR